MFLLFFFRSLSLLALNPVAVDDRHSQFATAARAKCAAQQKKEERNNAIHDLQSYRKDHCAVCIEANELKVCDGWLSTLVHMCVCARSRRHLAMGHSHLCYIKIKNVRLCLSQFGCVCV